MALSKQPKFHSLFTTSETNPVSKRSKFADDRTLRGVLVRRFKAIVHAMESDGKIDKAFCDYLIGKFTRPFPVQRIDRDPHGFTINSHFYISFDPNGCVFNFRDEYDQINHDAVAEIVGHMNAFLNYRGSGQAGDHRFVQRSGDTTARAIDPGFQSRGDLSTKAEMILTDLEAGRAWIAAPPNSRVKTIHHRDRDREAQRKTAIESGFSGLEGWIKAIFEEEFYFIKFKHQIVKILFVAQLFSGRRGEMLRGSVEDRWAASGEMPDEEIRAWINRTISFLGAGSLLLEDVQDSHSLLFRVLNTVDEFSEQVDAGKLKDQILSSGLVAGSQEADAAERDHPQPSKQWMFEQAEGLWAALYAIPMQAQAFANAGPSIGKDCHLFVREVPMEVVNYMREVPPGSANFEAVPLTFSPEVQQKADLDSDDFVRITQTLFEVRELYLQRSVLEKLRIAAQKEIPPNPQDVQGLLIRDANIMNPEIRARIEAKVSSNDRVLADAIGLVNQLLLTGRSEYTDEEKVRLGWFLSTIQKGIPWTGITEAETEALNWYRSLTGAGESPGDPVASLLRKGRAGLTLAINMTAAWRTISPKLHGMKFTPWNGAEGHSFDCVSEKIGSMIEVTPELIRDADGIQPDAEIPPEDAHLPSRLRKILDKIAQHNILFSSCAMRMELSDRKRSSTEGYAEALAGVISQEPLSHSVFAMPIRVGIPEDDRTNGAEIMIYAKQIPSALFRSAILRIQVRGFMTISDAPDASIESLRFVGYVH